MPNQIPELVTTPYLGPIVITPSCYCSLFCFIVCLFITSPQKHFLIIVNPFKPAAVLSLTLPLCLFARLTLASRERAPEREKRVRAPPNSLKLTLWRLRSVARATFRAHTHVRVLSVCVSRIRATLSSALSRSAQLDRGATTNSSERVDNDRAQSPQGKMAH